MDDSNLIQALRLLLGDKNIKEIKSVKLSMDDRGKDIISFKDQQDREVSMEVTIHYDNRSFDVVQRMNNFITYKDFTNNLARVGCKLYSSNGWSKPNNLEYYLRQESL